MDGYKVYPCGSSAYTRNYPQLVSQRRQNAGRLRAMGCRLIVQIDVDNSEKALAQSPTAGPSLACLRKRKRSRRPLQTSQWRTSFPRRNIETWIVFGNSDSLSMKDRDPHPDRTRV